MVMGTNVCYLSSLIGSYFLRKQKYIVGKIQLVAGLLSMLRSDWLSYYWAICYSPLVAKNAGFLAAKKLKSVSNFWLNRFLYRGGLTGKF